MSTYQQLFKIIDKELISFKELHQITNDELVTEIKEAKPDDKYKFCLKYDVKLANGELYFVYVKKNWYKELLRKNLLKKISNNSDTDDASVS